MKKASRWLVCLVGLGTILLSQAVLAQAPRAYPDKTVRVVVGYSPGGLPDTVARLLAQKLGERWGRQVVVENKPGANSSIAAEFVAKAAPDGYTLLVTDNSTTAINPFLYAKLPYDAERDLVPVTLAARAPLFLAVHSSMPVNTFQELVALVKSKPGQFTYGSSGIGSTHHLCMEFLKSSLGLAITHVPFKGTGQSVPALVAGQVPMVFSAYPSLSGYAKDGRVKFLAVNSIKRSNLAPNLPAIAETVPGFDFAPTIGFFVPAGTPKSIIDKISAEVREVLKLPDFITRATALGIEPVGSSPEDYASSLRADAERYSRAVKMSGAKAE
ncbi:MAG: tripartite tricarboxylate transporter substrate binding protein [Betaproteobacteria bacterium]|nr:tripartite tricarboxylate transporter substrate binding protein [Betaproteobacteria bacterium]